MQSWFKRFISSNNVKHRYFQNITNFPKNQSYSAMHFIFFVKKWCNFLTVYTFLKIAHYLASLTIYLSYLASVQISCMFIKICLFTMRVPNLTMFLFHTILTLNADINSSFCIFLNNYPNISVPLIQNLSGWTILFKSFRRVSFQCVDVCKILNSDVYIARDSCFINCGLSSELKMIKEVKKDK